jgi:hypothetical protein
MAYDPKVYCTKTRGGIGELDETTKLAYLAGIIDGEGFVGAYYWLSNCTLMYRVQITNTNKELMDYLKEEYGGKYFPLRREKAEHKVGMQWQLNGMQGALLLTRVLPYLRLKRKQAELVIELSLLQKKEYRLTREEHAQRLQIVDALRELNKKGRISLSLMEEAA